MNAHTQDTSHNKGLAIYYLNIICAHLHLEYVIQIRVDF